MMTFVYKNVTFVSFNDIVTHMSVELNVTPQIVRGW